MKGNDVSELLAKLTGGMDAKELTLIALQVSIASAITAKRIKLGMTQKQFANKMGVSQGLVSRWENGDANFTLETLVNIADALDIEISSPFAAEHTASGYTPSGGNIVNLHEFKQGFVSSPAASYSNAAELKEM